MGQPKSNPNFRLLFFFALSSLSPQDHDLYNSLNLLGVTQTVFFMVPEEPSTSSTVVTSVSGTQCLETILQFTCDPHMINLTYGNDSVPDDK